MEKWIEWKREREIRGLLLLSFSGFEGVDTLPNAGLSWPISARHVAGPSRAPHVALDGAGPPGTPPAQQPLPARPPPSLPAKPARGFKSRSTHRTRHVALATGCDPVRRGRHCQLRGSLTWLARGLRGGRDSGDFRDDWNSSDGRRATRVRRRSGRFPWKRKVIFVIPLLKNDERCLLGI